MVLIGKNPPVAVRWTIPGRPPVELTHPNHVRTGRALTWISGITSRKLAVASWSLSCFSKDGGSPGPECCYLIYQDYTPLPPLAGFNSTFSSSVPAAAAAGISSAPSSWLLAGCCCLLLARLVRLDALGWLLLLAACMLAAAGCWLPAACCLLLLVLKKAYSLEPRVVAFPLSRERC